MGNKLYMAFSMSKTPKYKRRTLLLAALSIFASVALLAALYMQQVVERELTKHLLDATNGKYQLDLGELKFSFFKKRVLITDFKLIGTPQAGESYCSIQAEELKIEALAVRKLLREKKLHLGMLSFIKPEITLHQKQKTSTADSTNQLVNAEKLLQQIQPFFKTTLHEIFISKFLLQKANISYYQNPSEDSLLHRVEKLDVSIDKLLLNEELIRNNQLFSSGNIVFQLSDLDYTLHDGLHQMHLERFTYLFHNNSFFGENLRITPTDSTLKNKPLFWIDLPHFGLQTTASKLSRVDSIVIDSLVALDAHIRYRPSTQKSSFQLDQLQQLDLYQLIKNKLQKFRIRYLKLDAKNLTIEAADSSQSPHIFQQMQLQAHELELDSLSAFNKNKFLHTDNFQFIVGHYSHRLKNKAQRIDAKQVQLNTEKRFIKTQNLQLITLDTLALPTNTNISCDSLHLHDISLHQLLHEQKLPLKQIAIYAPCAIVEQRAESPKEKQANQFQKQVLHLLNNYVDGLYAQSIRINNGKIELLDNRGKRSSYVSSEFQLKLQQFELDSLSLEKSKRLFSAESFHLLLTNYTMDMTDQIHQLDFDTIQLASGQEMVKLANAHLHPRNISKLNKRLQQKKRHQLYDISLPQLQLTHTNLLDAFFHQKLVIDQFEIRNPKIKVESFGTHQKQKTRHKGLINLQEFYQVLKGYMEHVQINQLSFHNASFQYKNQNAKGAQINFNNTFSMKLNQLLLNQQTVQQVHQLPAESFQFKIKNHTFELPDGVHRIYVDELNYSSQDSSLQVAQVKLYPNAQSENFQRIPWLYYIQVPSFHVNGINLEALGFNRTIDLADFKLENAKIKLFENYRTKQNHSKTTKTHSPLHFLMPRSIDAFLLNNVQLKQCELTILNKPKDKFQPKLNTSINAQFQGTSIRKDTLGRASFQVKTYQFGVHNFKQYLPENKHQLSFKELQVSSNKNSLEWHDFEWKTADSTGLLHRFIYLPKLSAYDINPEELISHQRFVCKQIVLDQPLVHWKHAPKNTSAENHHKEEIFFLKIPRKWRHRISLFQTEELTIRNAQIKLAEELPLKQINQVNMSFNQVHIDSLTPKKIFACESFQMHTENLQAESQLYRFKLNELAFSSRNQRLSLKGLNISPKIDHYSYQKHFEFQNDYMLVRLPELQVQKIDVENLFIRHALKAQKMLMKQLKFYSYRDKRLPFNQANRPPMPQDAIRKLPIAIQLDTIEISQANFTYCEQMNLTPEAYKVDFTETNALIHPFTNRQLEQHPNMHLNIQTKLLGVGELHAKLNFNMHSDSCPFSLNAELLPFNLINLSPITDNAALLGIKSGMLNKLLLHFNANKHHSQGKLTLDYEDLSLTALKFKNDKLKQRTLASIIANTIIPKRSKEKRKEKEAQIYYERDESKSIFNYLWKSVFSGLKDALGI